MRKDFFEELCREFAKEMSRLRMEQRAGLVGAKRELKRVKREIHKVIDAICEGVPGSEVKGRMTELQERKQTLLKQIETANEHATLAAPQYGRPLPDEGRGTRRVTPARRRAHRSL